MSLKDRLVSKGDDFIVTPPKKKKTKPKSKDRKK
jgi:hypothetical protein